MCLGYKVIRLQGLGGKSVQNEKPYIQGVQ